MDNLDFKIFIHYFELNSHSLQKADLAKTVIWDHKVNFKLNEKQGAIVVRLNAFY